MMDAIVISAIGAAAAFTAAWFVRPELRAWIEKPKYRFQESLEEFDRGRRS